MSFETLLYFFALVIVPIKNKEREKEWRKGERKEGWERGSGESAFI